MARTTLEETLEHLLLKRLEDAQTVNDASDEQEMEDWFDNPLTKALIDTIEADLLGLSLGFITNRLNLEQRKMAQAKIEVFSQIREYLEGGESWLEQQREEREDADSKRALHSSETE